MKDFATGEFGDECGRDATTVLLEFDQGSARLAKKVAEEAAKAAKIVTGVRRNNKEAGDAVDAAPPIAFRNVEERVARYFFGDILNTVPSSSVPPRFVSP
jgi:hypothetical protein